MLPKSTRSQSIQPFHVMRLMAQAEQLVQQGHDIVHMEVGEPDFATPQPIIDAAQHAIAEHKMHYTSANGLLALRQSIAEHYQLTQQVSIDPQRIVITPGSSGALLLALACIINPGQQVLMADPGYPCNRHFTQFLNGEAKSIAVDATTHYQLTADSIEQHWTDNTVAVLLASPSNPTGTLIEPNELNAIVDVVKQKNGVIIMDEIYHGLVYGVKAQSVLQYTENAFVVNSFSKYYGMTGWRLGWLVMPDEYVQAVENMAQNIFLAAPTPSQYAALAAFNNETKQILEQRRETFQQRRDYLLHALKALGFKIQAEPQGAFYIYANCSELTGDSEQLCQQLLTQANVAVTPGLDFGTHGEKQHVRFAYTTSLEHLELGVERIARFLNI